MERNIYEYQTNDNAHPNQFGKIYAENKQEALVLLRKKGINPIEISLVTEKENSRKNMSLWEILQRPVAFKNNMRQSEISSLLRQLSSLLEAGMPVDRSLRLLAKIPREQKSELFLSTGYEQVQKGNSLSQAWDNGFLGFPNYGISMLRAGEATGNLEKSLNRVADILERNTELRNLITSSLAYPVFLFVVSILVVVALLIYAVPQFLGIFSAWGEELPIATQLLVKVSHHIAAWGPFLLLLLLGGLIIILFLHSTPKGKYRWDSLQLQLPLFGRIFRDAASARLFQTFSALLGGGVNLPTSLRLAASASGNMRLYQGFMNSAQRVEQGISLAQVFYSEGVFPETAVELVALGEESGDLGIVVEQVAQLLERQTRQRINYLTTLLEPTMILFMAIIIGFIVLAILMPIVSMMDMPF